MVQLVLVVVPAPKWLLENDYLMVGGFTKTIEK
jgi:hypothetical protein